MIAKRLNILLQIALFFSFQNIRADSALPIEIQVPITFFAENAPEFGTKDIILPVFPVGLLVTEETAQKAGANSDDVVDRTCKLLMAIQEEDIDSFKKYTFTAEGQGITNPDIFFTYLQGLYFPENSSPIIVAYSKDKRSYCVWVTTTKNPSQLYALILEGPDLKWNLMTQGGQFNIVHDFLKGEDLAAAIKSEGIPFSQTDGFFDLKSQLSLDLRKSDSPDPQIEKMISQTNELRTLTQKNSGATDPKTKQLADALSVLSQAEAICTIGSISAVIGKTQTGETLLFYFGKDGNSYKPFLTQNYGPLGTFLLESFRDSKAAQQVSAENRAD